MNWTSQIFMYCERGLNPAFWAEPLNAASNAAFLLAGLGGMVLWARLPDRTSRMAELLLALLVVAISIGSFLFHTLATRWSAIADTAPIGFFMVAYVVYAVRRFAGAPLWLVSLGTALFVATLYGAGSVRCAGGPCLNGSVGYMPAFGALVVVGAVLIAQGHPAAANLFAGAGLFAASLTMRTIDRTVCAATIVPGFGPVGTHFLWHAGNGLLLYLLVRAAILHGRRSARPISAVA